MLKEIPRACVSLRLPAFAEPSKHANRHRSTRFSQSHNPSSSELHFLCLQELAMRVLKSTTLPQYPHPRRRGQSHHHNKEVQYREPPPSSPSPTAREPHSRQVAFIILALLLNGWPPWLHARHAYFKTNLPSQKNNAIHPPPASQIAIYTAAQPATTIVLPGTHPTHPRSTASPPPHITPHPHPPPLLPPPFPSPSLLLGRHAGHSPRSASRSRT